MITQTGSKITCRRGGLHGKEHDLAEDSLFSSTLKERVKRSGTYFFSKRQRSSRDSHGRTESDRQGCAGLDHRNRRTFGVLHSRRLAGV